jgi:hypothetical protein
LLKLILTELRVMNAALLAQGTSEAREAARRVRAERPRQRVRGVPVEGATEEERRKNNRERIVELKDTLPPVEIKRGA